MNSPAPAPLPSAETKPPSAGSGFSLAQMRRILATVIIGAGIVAYGNSLQGDFVLDDIPCIRENHALGKFLPEPSEVPPGLHHRTVGRWTFTVNYLLAEKTPETGPSVEGFHIANLIIHILAALVLLGL